MWVLRNLVLVRLEIVSVLEQARCTVCAKHNIASEIVWMHPMVRLGDEAQVVACFGLLEIVLILTQDRCSVCVEHTIGSEIILDAPD